MLGWLALLVTTVTAQQNPVLAPKQAQLDVQVYTASRVPLMPTFESPAAWTAYASALRTRILNEIVFRGPAAAEWRKTPVKVEWADTLEGNGYRVRKLRYQVLPGLWMPAALYEPAKLQGRHAAVINVNGHEREGISTPYIQLRCINLAKRGVIAINPEWLGKGQIDAKTFDHYRMQQIDITGNSGLAVFFLHMQRALDVLMSHANVDPARVTATGLSGGGWQTTMLSSLDERIQFAVPVAGHSSYVTRTQHPDMDLGDSEQTPSDLAAIADYTTLTAMVAPRRLMLINNTNDNCCFRADYALGPLVQSASSVYQLLRKPESLSYFINHGPGHNYDLSSRQRLYVALGLPEEELATEAEVRTADALKVTLPENNATFNSLARSIKRAPASTVKSVVRPPSLTAKAVKISGGAWRLEMSNVWNVPATETNPGASQTVLLIADKGRAQATMPSGKRVFAIDPFYFGESQIGKRDFLYAMLLAGLGERPLGLQAAQVIATAKHLGNKPALEAQGPRTSLIALLAASIEPTLFSSLTLKQSMHSLNEIITNDLTVDKQPELFCFGLLTMPDIPQLVETLKKHIPVTIEQ